MKHSSIRGLLEYYKIEMLLERLQNDRFVTELLIFSCQRIHDSSQTSDFIFVKPDIYRKHIDSSESFPEVATFIRHSYDGTV